jgi:dihydrolipoamide dehydrogenase
MPSKLLIAAANAAQNARKAAVLGIKLAELNIDSRAVLNRLRKERDAFVAATQKLIEELPPGIRVRSRARFVGETTLALDDGHNIAAKTVVIASPPELARASRSRSMVLAIWSSPAKRFSSFPVCRARSR